MEFHAYDQLPGAVRLSVLAQLQTADWIGARFLYDLLIRDALENYTGKNPRILLLMEDQSLVSLCTLSSRDEIHDTPLTPWIGFVYTAPAFRGHRYSEDIISYACALAKKQGYSRVYLSSDEVGLYEKYGFQQMTQLPNIRGEMTQVFLRNL